MKISTKGRYGLEALVDLAIYGRDEPMNIKLIAERQGIPEKYLEQIFTMLKKGGVIRSVRGAQGGYLLAEPTGSITVLRILTVLEGPLSPVACVTEGVDSDCTRYDFCVTRLFWHRMMEELNQVTDSVTLADLVACFRSANQKNELEYYI